MLYLIHCRDAPGSEAPRSEHLAAHLAWVEAQQETIRVAGPLRAEGGKTVGSCYVIEAEDLAGARRWFEADPYASAGIWGSVEIVPFLGVAGTWVGGCSWLESAHEAPSADS